MSDDAVRVIDPRWFGLTSRLVHATARATATVPGDPTKRAVTAALALQGIGQYAAAAATQLDRMLAAGKEAERAFAGGDDAAGFAALDQSYAEMHFYAVSWNAVATLLDALRKASGLKTPGRVYRRHRALLAHYTALRHHFEHLDQRLPGTSLAPLFERPNEDGHAVWGWRGSATHLFIGDAAWDISRDGLARLQEIVDELVTGLDQELSGAPAAGAPP